MRTPLFVAVRLMPGSSETPSTFFAYSREARVLGARNVERPNSSVTREEFWIPCGKRVSRHFEVIDFAGKAGIDAAFLAIWDSGFWRFVIL